MVIRNFKKAKVDPIHFSNFMNILIKNVIKIYLKSREDRELPDLVNSRVDFSFQILKDNPVTVKDQKRSKGFL